MDIKVKKLSENAKVPMYVHFGDAGADLSSAQDVTIMPGQTAVVMTDLSFELPDGIELQIRSRSGMAARHNVFVLNAPGTVDSSFTGNVGVVLTNLGTKVFDVKIGDRVAQAVLSRYEVANFEESVSIVKISSRGKDGFGSTGV